MTAEEIVRQFASMNPMGWDFDEQWPYCLFCDGRPETRGEMCEHTQGCLWVSAKRWVTENE
ncbi:hypothetical protein [Nitrolancea hollandica]|uniref:Uncharacterized protein n=1 Tax=Nitrolancea hollandica Lb TaxID=1129897 RepID=I4EFK7_9BACT|nr:hypothetical protein [Nitrolancea hollandica]CCF83469.1 hypothetical protein NITHO_2310012 [Nitrolancea hollandica Lb]